MTTGGIILAVAAALGWLVAARAYLELRRWAQRCKGARICIAYKRRVVLDAPILDWLTWARMLEKDEATRGRVVYRGSHVSVAIAKPAAVPQATVEKQP